MSIRKDTAVWICTFVSGIAKQQATVVYVTMHWVLLIQFATLVLTAVDGNDLDDIHQGRLGAIQSRVVEVP